MTCWFRKLFEKLVAVKKKSKEVEEGVPFVQKSDLLRSYETITPHWNKNLTSIIFLQNYEI